MMLARLGVSNALSTYDIFNLRWVYVHINPSQIEGDVYTISTITAFSFLKIWEKEENNNKTRE